MPFVSKSKQITKNAENDGVFRVKLRVKLWLSDMDSNHDKGLQRALCYHYTIGQTGIA